MGLEEVSFQVKLQVPGSGWRGGPNRKKVDVSRLVSDYRVLVPPPDSFV